MMRSQTGVRYHNGTELLCSVGVTKVDGNLIVLVSTYINWAILVQYLRALLCKYPGCLLEPRSCPCLWDLFCLAYASRACVLDVIGAKAKVNSV